MRIRGKWRIITDIFLVLVFAVAMVALWYELVRVVNT